LSNKFIGIPNCLVKQRGETLSESRRAIASHDLARICDMATLVRTGFILSVPATGEHELKADTIKTVSIKVGLVGHKVTIQRDFRGLSVVEAVETESCLTEKGLSIVGCNIPVRFWDIWDRIGKVPLICVSGYHFEVSWEGREGGVATVGIEQIVSNSEVSKLSI
jgi:hypothetical protein